MVLTHAHIDHSGYLPALVKNAFKGKIYCTKATQKLCQALLPDAGYLQEEDAKYAFRKKLSKHDKPKPLFTEKDAREAIKATEIFCRHHKEHRLSAEQCELIDDKTEFVSTVEQSIELNSARYPCVIVSASGMASGERVLHHLKTLLPNPRNSIVFADFQAPGTRGDALVNGAESVKIHGEYWPVKAEIYNLDSLSAHGDYEEILDWLGQGQLKPRKVFVTHGEMVASDEMRKRIRDRFGWDVEVPELFGEAGI